LAQLQEQQVEEMEMLEPAILQTLELESSALAEAVVADLTLQALEEMEGLEEWGQAAEEEVLV
jgi:hypothetical protein